MASESDTNMRELDNNIIYVSSKERTLADGTKIGKEQSVDYFVQKGIERYGEKKGIAPWYKGYNNETAYLMGLIVDNPILSGVLNTKCQILWGNGPKLHLKEKDEKGKIIFTEVSFDDWPSEIQDFYLYNEIDMLTYQMFQDHQFLGNYFIEMIFSKGSSQEEQKINELVKLKPESVRAYEAKSARGNIKKYAVSDSWHYQNMKKVENIKAFNHRDFRDRNMRFRKPDNLGKLLCHGKFKMPHFHYYTPPGWYGGRKWLEVQNQMPLFHSSNMLNMFGVRMIGYVNKTLIDRYKTLKNPSTGENFTEQEIMKLLVEVGNEHFTNPANAGKLLLTAYETDSQGKPIKEILWEPMTVDTNDEVGVKLNPIMNEAVTASTGTDASISGIIMNGKLSSGSEKAYSWNMEIQKGKILQNLVLKPLQFTHKFNQWDKLLKGKYEWRFAQQQMVTGDKDKNRMTEIQTEE